MLTRPTMTRRLNALLSTAVLLAAADCGNSASTADGKFEMYLSLTAGGTIEVTFLKGRCCGRLTVNSQTEEARGAVVELAESLAAAIPGDGSGPKTDGELGALVPAAGTGAFAGWTEDTRLYPAGPTIITTTAGDWADGSVGPFDEFGFEAVALEYYHSEALGLDLTLALVNEVSADAADQAFHYRSAGHPDEPFWDNGTRLH